MVKVNDYDVIEGLYYSEDYAWVKVLGDKVKVGITDYAQKQLREIVFAELPEAGDEIIRGDSYGALESVKAVSDLIAPVTGTVEEVNMKITDAPEILNQDPYVEGWILIVSPKNLDEDLEKLMTFERSLEWHKGVDQED